MTDNVDARITLTIDGTSAAASGLENANKQAVNLRTNLTGIKLPTQAAQDAKTLANEMDKVRVNAQKAGEAMKQSGGGGGNGLGAVAGLARSLGGQSLGEGFRVAEEAARVGQALAPVGASLSQVAVAAAPVAGVLAAVAIGQSLYNNALEDQRRQLDFLVTSIKTKVQAEQEATTRGILLQREKLMIEIDANKQARDAAATKALEEQKQISGTFQILLPLSGGWQAAKQKAEELNNTITDQYAKLDGLNKALFSLGAAANDVAASIDRQVNLFTLGAQYLNTGSTASIEARKKMIQAEGAIYQQAIDKLGAGEQTEAVIQQTQKYQEKLELLNAEYSLLDGEVGKQIAAKEKEAKGIEKDIAQKQRNSKIEAESNDLIATSTAKAVEDKIAANQRERESIYRLQDELYALPNQTDAVKAEIAKLEDRFQELSQENQKLMETTLPAIKAKESEAEATKRVSDAAIDFAKRAEELGTTLKDMRKKQAEWALADARDAQITGLEKRIEAAKQKEEAAASNQEMAKKRAELHTKELDLSAKYMQDSLKALKDFEISESRLDQDYATKRRRTLEDLYTNLTDLAAKGDVAGFIARQKQGNVDLLRSGQDFDTEKRRRAEEFARASDEKRAQFEKELVTQRQQGETELAQMKATNQVKLTESAKLEKQLMALKEQFAKEDKERTRAEEQAAFDEKINALRKYQDTDLRIVKAHYSTQLGAISAFAQAAANVWNQITGPIKRGGGPRIVPNAEGGIYDRPTLGLLGEHPGVTDVVFPLQRGEGLQRGLQRLLGSMGAGGITVQNDWNGANFGAVVTPDQLRQFGDIVEARTVQGVANAFKASRVGGAA